jgi:hypothetical protein
MPTPGRFLIGARPVGCSYGGCPARGRWRAEEVPMAQGGHRLSLLCLHGHEKAPGQCELALLFVVQGWGDGHVDLPQQVCQVPCVGRSEGPSLLYHLSGTRWVVNTPTRVGGPTGAGTIPGRQRRGRQAGPPTCGESSGSRGAPALPRWKQRAQPHSPPGSVPAPGMSVFPHQRLPSNRR